MSELTQEENDQFKHLVSQFFDDDFREFLGREVDIFCQNLIFIANNGSSSIDFFWELNNSGLVLMAVGIFEGDRDIYKRAILKTSDPDSCPILKSELISAIKNWFIDNDYKPKFDFEDN